MSEPLPVEIIALVEENEDQSPIVVLYHVKTNRMLPIWIGDAEARALALVLNKVPTPRPMTHELFSVMIKNLGGEILRVVIDRMEEQTYFATIVIDTKDGELRFDARPSDSIALALRVKAPIFVEKKIMDAAGQTNIFTLPKHIEAKLAAHEGPRKIILSKQDLERVADMLKQAREREEKS